MAKSDQAKSRHQPGQHQVAAPARAQDREAVAQQARQGLEVPGKRRDGEEVRLLGGVEVKLVLEQEPERQLPNHPRLAQGGDEKTRRDEKEHAPQVRRRAHQWGPDSSRGLGASSRSRRRRNGYLAVGRT
jgi:hypothetical protein